MLVCMSVCMSIITTNLDAYTKDWASSGKTPEARLQRIPDTRAYNDTDKRSKRAATARLRRAHSGDGSGSGSGSGSASASSR